MAVKFCAGSDGADFIAMYALVFAGLPTTSTRISREATASSALPCSMKILAFSSSRSLRSMPGPRGFAPTSIATSASRNASFGSDEPCMPASSGNAQSSISIITPLSAACALSTGSSSSCRMTGWSGPSICPEAMRNSRL